MSTNWEICYICKAFDKVWHEGSVFILLQNGISGRFLTRCPTAYQIETKVGVVLNGLISDLQLIEIWAYRWRISFNPDPSKKATELLFSQKKEENNSPLYFKNQTLLLSQIISIYNHSHTHILTYSHTHILT